MASTGGGCGGGEGEEEGALKVEGLTLEMVRMRSGNKWKRDASNA